MGRLAPELPNPFLWPFSARGGVPQRNGDRLKILKLFWRRELTTYGDGDIIPTHKTKHVEVEE